jgi:hypothetical protein
MTRVFASLIQKCEGSVSVVVGINPAESMHGALLNAAAIDLPRLKTMFVISCLLAPLCSHVTLSSHLSPHTCPAVAKSSRVR